MNRETGIGDVGLPSDNRLDDQTFPVTGTPAITAPSGGVIRLVPNGMEPPHLMP